MLTAPSTGHGAKGGLQGIPEAAKRQARQANTKSQAWQHCPMRGQSNIASQGTKNVAVSFEN